MNFLNNIKYLLLLVLLVLLQVSIFNHIHFLGAMNPYFYILFVVIYPIQKNKYTLLLYAFILGLFIDLFPNTSGVNTFATVAIAYFRIYLLKFLLSDSRYEKDELNLGKLNTFQWGLYSFLIVFGHYFLVDLLEKFSLNNYSNQLLYSGIGALVTWVCVLITFLWFPVRNTNRI